MTIKSWIRGLLLVAATTAVASGSVPRGGGALANGNFDNDLSGWDNAYNRPATWDPLDADGDPASGSVLLGNDMAVGNGGTLTVLSQCFLVSGGETVALGGHIRVPTGQPFATGAGVRLAVYSNDDCLTDTLANVYADVLEADDAWQAVQDEITLPPLARSMVLALGVKKAIGVTVETHAYFDRVYMVIAGDMIFSDGFEP